MKQQRKRRSSDGSADTRQRLTDSAVALFSENWYEGISIAEICRHSGLSNGVFYCYFRSKEELIKSILEGFLDAVEKRLASITGETVTDRLRMFYELVLTSSREDSAYINIFREGEYRYPEYEKRLKRSYMEAMKLIFRREVTIEEYIFLVGSLRFMLRRPFFSETQITADDLIDAVSGGIYQDPGPWDPQCLNKTLGPAYEDAASADTKTRLLIAGRDLIGEKGYHAVNVYEICRSAGYAVGTFYINFESKEDFFAEVIQFLNRGLRGYISSNLDSGLSRFEQELQGWIIFLQYFTTHVQNYQIVREAEFVIRDAAREYYDTFEQGYVKNLRNLRVANPVLAANFLTGIAHHLGIEYFFSKSIDHTIQTVSELGRLICRGIRME